jgi:hypothetical protein
VTACPGYLPVTLPPNDFTHLHHKKEHPVPQAIKAHACAYKAEKAARS